MKDILLDFKIPFARKPHRKITIVIDEFFNVITFFCAHHIRGMYNRKENIDGMVIQMSIAGDINSVAVSISINEEHRAFVLSHDGEVLANSFCNWK